jgi:very-long-chain ceramide synthase
MLKYLGYNTICDYAFGVFLVTWIVGRHFFYIGIVHSVWKGSIKLIPYGCWTSNSEHIPVAVNSPDISTLMRQVFDPTGTVCYTKPIQYSFITLLLVLQVITLMWFYMILRVAWKVIKGGGADDTRSDDEDDGEDEEDEKEDEVPTKPVDSAQMNGTAMSTASFPSSLINGASHRHISSQPLGGS